MYLTTPFLRNDWTKIDEDGLRKNIQFLKNSGVQIIVCCAGTGEIYSLSLEEIKMATKICAEEKGKMKLIASIPPGLPQALELSKYAQNIGADLLLIFPPIGPITEEGMYLYHKKICETIDVGVQIYNTGTMLQCSQPTFKKIIDLDKVIAIKDETGEFNKLANLMHSIDKKVAWIYGINYRLKVAKYYFMLGVNGFTCGISNILPKLTLELYKAAVNKDWNKVQEIETLLTPLEELRRRAGWITVVKAALDLINLSGGPPRPPLTPLEEKEREELKKILDTLLSI